MRYPIGVHASAKVTTRKNFYQVRKRKDTFDSGWIEPCPIPNVFFRPEEIHRASGIGGIFKPLPKGHCHIGHQTFGVSSKNFPIPNLHPYGKPAIETRGIDLNCFPRKEPADCQRLEPSLAKPFLLPFNRDSILSGKIVERSKGGNVIRTGIEPSGNAWCCQKIVKGFSALFYGHSQTGCDLRIMRRLSSFYHSLHDKMKRPI